MVGLTAHINVMGTQKQWRGASGEARREVRESGREIQIERYCVRER